MRVKLFSEYLHLLSEGGNALGAEPIPVKTKEDRKALFEKVKGFFEELNEAYKNKFNPEELWSEHSLNNILEHFSGSTKHVLNHKQDLPQGYKEMGDLDVMVDTKKQEHIKKFFDELKEGTEFNGIKFVNVHQAGPASKQVITVWETPFDQTPQKFQIDFEFVDMAGNGTPTEFSKFAHSTHYNDLSNGIKGAFHKLLIRAISRKGVSGKEVTFLQAKGKTTKGPKEHEYSFSVDGGLRPNVLAHSEKSDTFKKLNSTDIKNALASDSKLKELHLMVSSPLSLDEFRKHLQYDKDVTSIRSKLFGKDVDKDKFNSFLGLICLINEHLLPEQKDTIIKEFANLLWEVSPYKKGDTGTLKLDGTLLYRIFEGEENLEDTLKALDKDFSAKETAVKYLLGSGTEPNKLVPSKKLTPELLKMANKFYQVALTSKGHSSSAFSTMKGWGAE